MLLDIVKLNYQFNSESFFASNGLNIWYSKELQYVIFIQISSELNTAQKGPVKDHQKNVDNMPLLLATIYESARLLPAGPLLQRCSLKQGIPRLNYSWVGIEYSWKVYSFFI